MNLGQRGEELACGFLVRQGLVLIEKNFRLRLGEVDLIMREGKTLVFVEVKYRSSHAYGGALAAVTPRKQRKIKLVAEAYLQRFSETPIVRFDVVGISPQGSGYRFDWVKGAFE